MGMISFPWMSWGSSQKPVSNGPKTGPPPVQPPPSPPQGQKPGPAVCTGVPLLNLSLAHLTGSVGPLTETIPSPTPGGKPGPPPNNQADVLLIQKLINAVSEAGYVDVSVLGGVKLIENGIFSVALKNAIVKIERLYFHGRANPHGIGVIDPQADESMFVFLVGLARGCGKAKQQLSVQMYALAAAMVPSGRVMVDSGGMSPDGNMQPHKMTAISKYLPGLLDALTEFGLNDTDMVLIALACACTETSTFIPIDETKYDLNTTGTFTNTKTGEQTYESTVDNVHGRGYHTLLEHNHLQSKSGGRVETFHPGNQPGDIYNGELGNAKTGTDGWTYRGRGLIQITGKSWYQKTGDNAGVGDLFVKDPDMVNDLRYAGKVVAGFLKFNAPKLRQALARKDLDAVRAIVNGGTNGGDAFKKSWADGVRVISQVVIQEAKIQVKRKRKHPRRKKA